MTCLPLLSNQASNWLLHISHFPQLFHTAICVCACLCMTEWKWERSEKDRERRERMKVGGKVWAWYLAHTVQSLLLRLTQKNVVCLGGPPNHICTLTFYAKDLACCLTRLTIRYMLPLYLNAVLQSLWMTCFLSSWGGTVLCWPLNFSKSWKTLWSSSSRAASLIQFLTLKSGHQPVHSTFRSIQRSVCHIFNFKTDFWLISVNRYNPNTRKYLLPSFNSSKQIYNLLHDYKKRFMTVFFFLSNCVNIQWWIIKNSLVAPPSLHQQKMHITLYLGKT